MHILLFSDDENLNNFVLGRGHESDLRISDISVSRSHARIFYENDQYYIEDLSSKFGTLVLATDPIEMKEENKVFQISKTLASANKSNQYLG